MILYLSVSTDLEDLVIDYIEFTLVTGETVSLDWDESDIEWLDDGFNARYKGVYFDEEYANGKLSSLREMQIDKIDIYAESEDYTESDIDIDDYEESESYSVVITEMIFEDAGEQYDLEYLLPYVTSIGG